MPGHNVVLDFIWLCVDEVIVKRLLSMEPLHTHASHGDVTPI